jgi:DNA-directed RNA polymerase subunit RPC12/RpoP
MCIHETIQLSQDGERVIVCGDCGREFAKIQDDDAETLVVPVEPGRSAVLLNGDLGTGQGAVAVTNRDGHFQTQPVYPCARCGWSASCPKVEGEECHT